MSDISNNTAMGAGTGTVAGAGAGYKSGGPWGALIGAIVGAGSGVAIGQHYGRGLKKKKAAMDDALREYETALRAHQAQFGGLNQEISRRGADAVSGWRTGFEQHVANSPDMVAEAGTARAAQEATAGRLVAEAFRGSRTGGRGVFDARAEADARARAAAQTDPLTTQRGFAQAGLSDVAYSNRLRQQQARYESSLAEAGSLGNAQRAEYEAALRALLAQFPMKWEEAQHAGDRQLMLAMLAQSVFGAAVGGAGGMGGMGGTGGGGAPAGDYGGGGTGNRGLQSDQRYYGDGAQRMYA